MDSSIFSKLIYYCDDFWSQIGDHRVIAAYPLMSGGPLPIIGIVSLYLYFILVAGPKFMKSREPFKIDWTIRTYNICMSLVNLIAFCHVSRLTNFGLSYFGCKRVGTSDSDRELIEIGYIYFASKIVELLDTVFFILRKKNNQASGLHIFHHSFIAVCVWVYFKVAPGGSSVLFPYLNSFVHSIMYGYYFLATFKGMQKYLWWKRYLTLLQIVQFVLSMVHFSFQGLSSCEYPAWLAVVGFVFNFVFFALFCDFYHQNYMRHGKPKSAISRHETEKKSEHQADLNVVGVQRLTDKCSSPRVSLSLKTKQDEPSLAQIKSRSQANYVESY